MFAQGADAVITLVRSFEARIEELERRAGRNSQNSSMSPSQDPPASRAERRRKAREAYKRSMRKQGAQPGHEGKSRQLAGPERLDGPVDHLPERCSCGHVFSGGEQQLGEPVVFQQWELPVIRPLVFEHRRLRLCCPCCGRSCLAELPGPALSGYGPRLQAQIVMLAGVFRLSRDQVRQLVEEVFGIPSSKGVIDNTIMRVSAILSDPWAELKAAVRGAESVHMDETTWRLKGAVDWLWVATSALYACYRVDPHRSQAAAKALIGEEFGGFVISDRYAGYHFLDVLQQQLCVAHVIRQYREISQHDGIAGQRGARLVELAGQAIKIYHDHLAGDRGDRPLADQLKPVRDEMRTLLEALEKGRDERAASFAQGLLEEYDALWTFADVPDANLSPTNNRAEQAMRHAVIMRKLSGGSQSHRGERFVERIESVRETCRLQGRNTLHWLTQATTAAHNGQPPPSLTPI